jgi:hypothetical protein
MPVVLATVLLVLWIAMAYREFQRGNLMLAAVFLLVGIGLAVFRLRVRRAASPRDPAKP